MITEKSLKYMSKAFRNTKYTFGEIPNCDFKDNYGIYVHVPFCFSKCSFCPFYKTLYNQKKINDYMMAVIDEIWKKRFGGEADWLYIGGGTPNTLSLKEIGLLVSNIKQKAKIKSMGIELLPSKLDKGYIEGLRAMDFKKISVGIESLSGKVLSRTGRKNTDFESMEELIVFARKQGLWVNVDMMTGLPGQIPHLFLEDIDLVKALGADQITIYPYMRLNKLNVDPGYEDKYQFESIEKAREILGKEGYRRIGIWTFAFGDDVYDSSRDELIRDYMGLGPAAFSTYDKWKVVNPGLEVYLQDYFEDKRRGFLAEKNRSTDSWRNFSRMLYDLECRMKKTFPAYIKLFVLMLKITGYAKRSGLSLKGRIFVHSLTKTVVESLPYPLQNPQNVTNYQDYAECIESLKNPMKAKA